MLFAIEWNDETITKIISAVIIFFATTAASFVVGRWWGRYQAWRQWNQKKFLGRVIVSLNSFADDTLKIRTVFERSLEEVFLNPVAVEKIQDAARRTKVDNPILPIEPADRWFLLNFVLNAVAERFSAETVRYDAGAALKPVSYLIFLTCELVGEDRLHKVRAMMMRKDLFDNFPYPEAMPKLEQHWHSDRVLTLRRAVEIYRKEPDNFLPIEIYV